jgi:hypothetical protein
MNQPMGPGGTNSNREGGIHTVKAVVVIAIVVALGVFVLARVKPAPKSSASASGGSATTVHHGGTTTLPPPTTSTTLVPVAAVKLQVLNGVLTGSLAGQWSAKLRANPGYSVLTPYDATARVASSVIYVITPGYGPEGNALAAVVGLPTTAVQVVVPATAPIPPAEKAKANLVLIIGPDLEASA